MEIKFKPAFFLVKKATPLFIMRLFIFLFSLSLLSFIPEKMSSQNVKLVIKQNQIVTVDQVFEIIKYQTDYRFIYRADIFNDLPKIQLKKGVITLKALLDLTLADSHISYKESADNTIIISKQEPVKIVFNDFQDRKLKGVVRDINGVPIPGINVYVSKIQPGPGAFNRKSVLHATVTDFEGSYTIDAADDHYLSITGMGFQMQTVRITKMLNEYDFTMKEEVSSLDEVMVVGYGTTKKKDLTGSVSSVKAEQIQQVKTQSLDQALGGQMAGVFVQGASGAPGSGARVYIRGLSQIKGDNQPLYVIDGVPVIITPNTDGQGALSLASSTNPLLSINPADVERVDVLKDASAAAIYGSRAANGVIMVTTKRAKKNSSPSITFGVSTTAQTLIDEYEYLSANDWKSFMTKSAKYTLDNSNMPESDWPFYYPAQTQIVNNPEDYFGTANTNWQKEITRNTAFWNDYRLTIGGGTEKVNYGVSMSVSDQEGLMLDDKFKRYSIAPTLDASITDGFKVGVSLNYNYSKYNRKGFSSLESSSFRPDLDPYNEDGSYTSYYSQGLMSNLYTVLGNGKQTKIENFSDNLLTSVYGEITILEGLKFKSQLGIGLNSDNTQTFYSSKSGVSIESELFRGKPGAQLSVYENRNWTTSFNNTLSYTKVFKKHQLESLIGVSWDRSRYDTKNHFYRGFPDDEILIDVNSANFTDDAMSESIQQGLNSIFGRVNYSYGGKYLATITMRRDGSTKFGPDNRYGFFPSGALAWNMHEESFLKENKLINQLKLRASLGKTGSDNLPSFTYLTYFKSGDYNARYNEIDGLIVSGIPNKGIRWEETRQLDLGLELGLFNNRLNAEIVYFEKHTSGIILNAPVPYETGETNWSTNLGDVSNKGWELTIGGDIFRKENFTWNSSLNISFIKNKVEDLYGGNVGGQMGIIEGQPIGTIYGFDVVKIAQTQEEIDDLNQKAGTNGSYQSTLVEPGDYIYKDINNDGFVNQLDRTPLGNINPDYFGGWNNTLTYKNWNFSMNWTFVKGIERVYSDYFDLSFVDYNTNITSIAYQTWAPDNQNAKYARYGSESHGHRDEYNSKMVVDASYARLRSLSIGYQLPKALFRGTAIAGASVTVSGNNLITISHYPGIDPEISSNSALVYNTNSSDFLVDNKSSYPQAKTFTIALNVKF